MLVALEVNDTIALLVAATPMPYCNTALIVTPRFLPEWSQ
jgi:hypothetical protein